MLFDGHDRRICSAQQQQSLNLGQFVGVRAAARGYFQSCKRNLAPAEVVMVLMSMELLYFLISKTSRTGPNLMVPNSRWDLHWKMARRIQPCMPITLVI